MSTLSVESKHGSAWRAIREYVLTAVPRVLRGSIAIGGSYRRAVGWRRDRRSTASDDASFELLSRAH